MKDRNHDKREAMSRRRRRRQVARKEDKDVDDEGGIRSKK